jgi:hypothetical protein
MDKDLENHFALKTDIEVSVRSVKQNGEDIRNSELA